MIWLPGWAARYACATAAPVPTRPTGRRCTRAGRFWSRGAGKYRQAAVLVRRAAVSVTGGVLPGVLARVLTAEFREAGLAGRMLLAMPPPLRRQWSEAEMEPAVQQTYEAVGTALGKLGFGRSEQGADLPAAVNLSPAAKARWIELYNAWGECASEAAAGEAAGLAQLPSHAARLALLHHLVEKAPQGRSRSRWRSKAWKRERRWRNGSFRKGSGSMLSSWNMRNRASWHDW